MDDAERRRDRFHGALSRRQAAVRHGAGQPGAGARRARPHRHPDAPDARRARGQHRHGRSARALFRRHRLRRGDQHLRGDDVLSARADVRGDLPGRTGGCGGRHAVAGAVEAHPRRRAGRLRARRRPGRHLWLSPRQCRGGLRGGGAAARSQERGDHARHPGRPDHRRRRRAQQRRQQRRQSLLPLQRRPDRHRRRRTRQLHRRQPYRPRHHHRPPAAAGRRAAQHAAPRRFQVDRRRRLARRSRSHPQDRRDRRSDHGQEPVHRHPARHVGRQSERHVGRGADHLCRRRRVGGTRHRLRRGAQHRRRRRQAHRDRRHRRARQRTRQPLPVRWRWRGRLSLRPRQRRHHDRCRQDQHLQHKRELRELWARPHLGRRGLHPRRRLGRSAHQGQGRSQRHAARAGPVRRRLHRRVRHPVPEPGPEFPLRRRHDPHLGGRAGEDHP